MRGRLWRSLSLYATLKLMEESGFDRLISQARLLTAIPFLLWKDREVCDRHSVLGRCGWQGLILIKLITGISRCESECLTVAKSCQSILEPVELDELSVKLWRGNSADKVKAQLCSSKKKRVCAVARPEVPVTYQRQDFVFKAMKAKDLQMEKLMADMNGAGMVSCHFNGSFSLLLCCCVCDISTIAHLSTSGWSEDV